MSLEQSQIESEVLVVVEQLETDEGVKETVAEGRLCTPCTTLVRVLWKETVTCGYDKNGQLQLT